MTAVPPEEIRALKQWVAWCLKPDPRGTKPRKVPVSPHGGSASSTDPATWSTYEHASETAAKIGHPGRLFFALTPPFVGVDLDHARDPATGVLSEEAARIVERIDSYTEVSPSLDGVHATAKGTLPPVGRKRGNIEMYCGERFFSWTGNHLASSPVTINERSSALHTVHREVFGAQPAPAPATPQHHVAVLRDVRSVVDRATRARNGESFRRLFDGGLLDYPSASEADSALVFHLAFWTGGDASLIDACFRASGLYRPKWDERRGAMTYGQRCIQHALTKVTSAYEPRQALQLSVNVR